jgi:S1-C subfamily serine protease
VNPRGPLQLAVVALAAALLGCVLPPDVSSPVPSADATPLSQGTQARRVAQDGVLRVRTISCGGGVGSGSAFSWDGTTLVTNRHVVENAWKIELSTWDGYDLAADVIGVAYVSDLALIRTRSSLLSSFEAGSPPSPGDPVYVVGYPGGVRWTIQEGTYFGRERIPAFSGIPAIEALVIDADRTAPGSSGGPVLDAQGRVVGVIYAVSLDQRGNSTGEALAISVQELTQLERQRSFTAPPKC